MLADAAARKTSGFHLNMLWCTTLTYAAIFRPTISRARKHMILTLAVFS